MLAPQSPPTPSPAHVTAVLRILVLSTFVVLLNETIMVNAIPRLMREFEVTAAAAGWLSTAFMLTMAVVIPVTGWFLQRVTTRTAFGLAMTLFLVGTALAAAAPVFPVLLAARVIQAGGTAVMMPLLMTTLMTLVPPHDRGRVMGNITLVISVAPALGPAVSGVLLQAGSWRLLFLAVLPIAAAMAVFGRSKLTNIGEPQAGPIDWPSVPLAAAGFGALVYGLSGLGAESAAAAPLPPEATTAAGAVLVGLFVWRQLALQRSSTPLLDLRALTFRHFSVALGLMCLSFMALMGAFILLPIYLQEVRGLSSLQTGLLLIPGGLTMGLLGPQVGKLYDRLGAPRLVIPGAALTALCLALFALTDAGTSPWLVLALHVVLSAGMAFVFTPVFTSGLAVLPPHLYPHGSAILGSLQQVAAAAGTALVISVMSGHAATAAAEGADPTGALATGIRWGFGVGAVIGLLAVVVALLVRTPPVPQQPAEPETENDGDGAGTTTDKTAPTPG
ncbi:DHA2 family efflux MFS transporter permease subunit [Streptomyces venezuelae]|uniref:DHA2 family efflux MFS transporter permease subunit n=1 Tax=Streptomyces venezuelae TaxID=54571 RepID=UPI001239B53A|nr:DHA2 family efflux MFS transporter permease subunit [Streptomyces venezuelae]QES04387.1 DHA2 family efflux MFS transporter permease subunit [Streptomyces venezuelae]